jgi:UDP:flavonoid glycosyltransferase YjiC (YdhE family)
VPSFLFATLDAGGNVPPALGIARELLDLGHRVRFLGQPRQAAAITATGAGFQAYNHGPQMNPTEHMPAWREMAVMLSVFASAGAGQDLVEEARKEPPDVVVVDCLLLGAVAAAVKAGFRTVPLVHSFYAFFDGPFRRNPLAPALALRGLGPGKVMKSSHRILVAADRQLDPAGKLNGHGKAVWTGAVVNVERQATAPAPGTTPRILVSLSTTAFNGQEAFLQKALNALADLPVEVVLTTGPAIAPTSVQAPPNTTVHEFVPHREVMPDCSAVLGHGGHATTMLALAHGLPLVIAPMHPMLDQRMVGQAVEDAGAGLLIKPSAAPDEIVRAVTSVLNVPAFSTAASAVGRRLRDADGARAGARLLAEIAG